MSEKKHHWKCPALAPIPRRCKCKEIEASSPAPTAPAQVKVDHAWAKAFGERMAVRAGPEVYNVANLARSHAALVLEVEHWRTARQNAMLAADTAKKRAEAAERRMAELEFAARNLRVAQQNYMAVRSDPDKDVREFRGKLVAAMAARLDDVLEGATP